MRNSSDHQPAKATGKHARHAARHGKRDLMQGLEPRLLLTVFNVAPGNLIQPVIDAAASGDTIHIAAGHYAEQLTINGKNLTLTGDGAGLTFIDAPVTLATSFTTSAVNKAVVTFLNTAAGNINNLTIDGLGHGNINGRFIGLAYRNAGGVADHLVITHVTDTPLDSVQAGVAIYAFDDNGTPNSLTIFNDTLVNYQKAGASLNGANLTVNVLNNTVTGTGPNAVIAQNGIQLSFGAAGVVSGNTITGNQYNGTQNAQGAAVLMTQSGGLVSVLSNTLQHNDGGVVTDSPASIFQNTLSQNAFGIELFGTQTGGSISNNFILSNSQYGIYIDAGITGTPVIHNNSIAGNGQYGVVDGSGLTIDAGSNWWGYVGGPTTNTTSGGDPVFGPVVYAHWLLNGVDADAGTPGFQPLDPVTGRFVFYNNSAFDGNNAAANAADDGAIAPDKTALLPGGTATFANYTSYSKGINGLMIDVLNLVHTENINATDFVFKVGRAGDPASWTAAPAPTTVLVRGGAGANGADRIELVWPDGAIKNVWMQVTLLANADTGLATNSVFYFGNVPGETGDSLVNTQVTATDEIGTRANAADLSAMSGPAALANVYDFNRDKAVDSADEAIAGSNYMYFFNALPLISVPAVGPSIETLFDPASTQVVIAPLNPPAAPAYAPATDNVVVPPVSGVTSSGPAASTLVMPMGTAATVPGLGDSGVSAAGAMVTLVKTPRTKGAAHGRITSAPKRNPRATSNGLKKILFSISSLDQF